MIGILRGETVSVRLLVGDQKDRFNNPVETYGAPSKVHRVLVAPASGEDVIADSRDGQRIVYTLHFPKGYGKDLTGALIEVRGEELRVVGSPKPFTEANVPGPWSMPVQVVKVDG